MSRIKYDAITPPGGGPLPTARILPEAGRIRTGIKGVTAGGQTYPKAVDYFVIQGNFAHHVTQKYGEKPPQLPICFYSDVFDEVCNERLEIRDKGGKLYGWGDGLSFSIFNAKTRGYTVVMASERPDIMEATQNYLRQGTSGRTMEPIRWEPVLTLRFVIKDVPVLGYWQYSTKAALTTIPNLRQGFDACLAQFGTVAFFPFLLTVKMVKSNSPGEARQYPVVDIVAGMSLETGLKISQHIQHNPGWNPAQIALMDVGKGITPDQLSLPESTVYTPTLVLPPADEQ